MGRMPDATSFYGIDIELGDHPNTIKIGGTNFDTDLLRLLSQGAGIDPTKLFRIVSKENGLVTIRSYSCTQEAKDFFEGEEK